jgi:hypothetical protein
LRWFTNVNTASRASSLVFISLLSLSGRIITTFLGGPTAICATLFYVILTFSAYVIGLDPVFVVLFTAVSSRSLVRSVLLTASSITIPWLTSYVFEVLHDCCRLLFIDFLCWVQTER